MCVCVHACWMHGPHRDLGTGYAPRGQCDDAYGNPARLPQLQRIVLALHVCLSDLCICLALSITCYLWTVFGKMVLIGRGIR
jgi:hypothetical protein